MYNSDPMAIVQTDQQIPQLRIAVTSVCGKACIYCRPGGETFPLARRLELSNTEIIECVKHLSSAGIHHVKITGGDPMLRNDIVSLISSLKKLPNIEYVELVTRHHRVGNLIDDLINAGIDCLNFSLDSLNEITWSRINRAKGFKKQIEAIKLVAQAKVKLKINTVVLQGINDHEIPDLITFIANLGGGTLKLLDLIDDIPCWGVGPILRANEQRNGSEQVSTYRSSLVNILRFLRRNALSETIKTAPGGLGHPMMLFAFPENMQVLVKDARSGAFYGNTCRSCSHFPCHDALMALRLTPDGKLQRCLLRSDNLLDLHQSIQSGSKADTTSIINKAFTTYLYFRSFQWLNSMPKSTLSQNGRRIDSKRW